LPTEVDLIRFRYFIKCLKRKRHDPAQYKKSRETTVSVTR
jgi:hypothetical protein